MLKQKNNGFTLIEVIIALSIFAVLSVIGYKGLNSLIQTKERVAREDDKWQQLVLFFDRMELDVKQSVNRPVRGRNGDIEPAFIGHATYAGKYEAQLIFSRFGDREQSGFLMDTRRIAYRLNNGAVELLIWPSLDAAPTAKPEIFRVLSNVAQMTISYLTKDGRLVSAWPDSLAVSEPKAFAPYALKVSIKLSSGEMVTRLLAL